MRRIGKRSTKYSTILLILIGILIAGLSACESDPGETEASDDTADIETDYGYSFNFNEDVRGDYGITLESCGPFFMVQDNKKDDQPDKMGAFNENGELVIPCDYSWIEYIGENRWIVEKKEVKGLVDEKGKEILPCEYYYLDKVYDGSKDGKIPMLISAKKEEDEKITLLSAEDGKTYLETDFDEIWHYAENGLAPALSKKGKYGYVDLKGNTVIKPKYEDAERFEYGGGGSMVARVVVNEKQGYIDETGKEVIPCKYDFVSDYNNGLAVANNIKYEKTSSGEELPIQMYGVVDGKGNEIIPIDGDENEKYIYLEENLITVEYYEPEAPGSMIGEPEYYTREGKRIDEKTAENLKKKQSKAKEETDENEYSIAHRYKELLKQGDNGLWAITDKKGNPLTEYIFNTEYGHE